MPPSDPQSDQDFQKASRDDQHAYLMATDPDYAKAAPADQAAYLKQVAPPPAVQEPGILDKEIPLDSTLHATESGLQSVGRGMRDALTGVKNLVAHPIDTAKSLISLPSQAAQVPAAIRDINASPDPLGTYAKAAQETAGQGAGQAIVAAGTEGLRGGIKALPESVKAAPIRLAARSAEGIVNSSPIRSFRSAAKIFTPAEDARGLVRIPGRDAGLNVSERPSPVPKIGSRYVVTPEEAARLDQIQRIAKRRASERGMQYAGGMKPTGAKIATP